MNLLLAPAGSLLEGRPHPLNARHAEHLRTVLKTPVGGTVALGELGGRWGRAERLADDSEGRIQLAPKLDQSPPPKLPLALVIALPRPKILRKVLQAAASMGVAELALVGSWKVEKSFWQSPFLAPEAIEAELVTGLEQGRDTVLPRVALHRHFKPFVEDVLPGFGPAGASRLLPDVGAHPPLPARLEARAAVLAIGPEGGWTPYEVERLVQAGFAPVSPGPHVLRVDVAVPFFVGQALHALTDAGPRNSTG